MQKIIISLREKQYGDKDATTPEVNYSLNKTVLFFTEKNDTIWSKNVNLPAGTLRSSFNH